MRYISFLRYILGYVQISVGGEFPEKLLNNLANNKISFWDTQKTNKIIYLKLSVKDFKRIKKVKGKNKFYIRIIKKCGAVFIFRKYIKRIGIPVGISVFLLLLYIFSLFIWNVSVVGNETVSKDEIIKNANEIGVKNGALISRVDSQLLREKMLLKNDKLAWCSFNIEGTKITINVSEIVEKEESYPTNIVADYDCIVSDILVESGVANVKKGDAVSKGDILVSGISSLNENYKFVKAKAKIEGIITEKVIVSGEFSGEKLVPSGKIKKQNTLEFFSLKIPLYFGKIKGEYLEEINIRNLYLFGEKMPISVHNRTLTLLENRGFNRNREELLFGLENEIKNKIQENTSDYEIISKNIEAKDNNLTLIYSIKFTKNIGKEEKIIFNISN